MIKKLRRKFILINMALVAGVLLIVFGALCFFNYQQLQGRSMEAMRQAIQHTADKAPPQFEIGDKRPGQLFNSTPIFLVTLDGDGNISSVASQNLTVSDEVAAEAVERALATGKEQGTVSDLSLRFLKQDTPSGVKLAFADRSSENSAMIGLLLNSLLVGGLGLAAFFCISLFLSGWVLRPVERAWEQQRQFVADASHELKTPLTVILANAGILAAHKEDTIAHQIKWVEYIKAEADRMKQLVEDLLFLAKSDATRVRALGDTVALSDLCWSCLLPFEPVAFEAGLTLQNSIEPDIACMGDKRQLEQLVGILLDNACKYAGKGGTVTLGLERSQGKAKLWVRNTGEPIPEEHLGHLFERFYRVDGSRARSQGGYGLGLSIAHSIVKSHHGRITVESSQQLGNTFTVTLPIKM